MECCDNILDLGCVGYCDTIETGVTAPATATYKISLVGSGGVVEYDFTSGAEIRFTNPFNEDSVAVFQILRNGVPLTSGVYDCFQVKVKSGLNTTGSTTDITNTFNVYYNGTLIDTVESSDTTVTINIFS